MHKVLEAILKGILMGLLIQDDELDLPTFQGSLITSDYHADRTNQIKWVRENFVDLGLPSGTLWCKYNIGATNGDTKESWYGNYYAWGEVETKEIFTWGNYKFCNRSSVTKYNSKDNKANLDPEDDVVSVTLGKDFRMPTKEDFEELCSLPSEWVENYSGVGGLNGRVFVGNNGKQLFIPAAGYCHGSDNRCVSSDCYMWSSSLTFTDSDCAYYLCFYSWNLDPFYGGNRYYGQSVRGVL